MARSSPTTTANTANEPARAPLEGAELVLATAAHEAVLALRALAGAWREGAHKEITPATATFEQACANMAAAANDANLFPVIAHRGDAGLAVLALMVERMSLGLGPMTINRQTGQRESVPSGEVFEEIADSINQIQTLGLAERIVALIEDRDIAPLAVGAHVAREGLNDPFCGQPWTPPDLGLSLAAAAIASATLIHVAQALGVAPEDYGSLSEISAAELVKAAGAAYLALETRERLDLAGFGVASQVIEDILRKADYLTGLAPADAHRVSVRLGATFSQGFKEGRATPNLGVSTEFEEEANETARALIIAAHACGFIASHDEGLSVIEPAAGARRSAFGRLPGAENLQ